MSEWYFAYGANMASQVLRRRGVSALESHAARLDGHRLVFEEPGIPGLEPVFACLSEAHGEAVYGVAHRLSEKDMAALDRVEGLGYDRVEHAVEIASGIANGCALRGLVDQ